MAGSAAGTRSEPRSLRTGWGAVTGADRPAPAPHFVYDDAQPLWDKLQAVARRVYRAQGVRAPAAVRARLEQWQREGHGRLAVCIAKTPYSFGTDERDRGAHERHGRPRQVRQRNAEGREHRRRQAEREEERGLADGPEEDVLERIVTTDVHRGAMVFGGARACRSCPPRDAARARSPRTVSGTR